MKLGAGVCWSRRGDASSPARGTVFDPDLCRSPSAVSQCPSCANSSRLRSNSGPKAAPRASGGKRGRHQSSLLPRGHCSQASRSWPLLPSACRDPCPLPRSMELPLRSESLEGQANPETPEDRGDRLSKMLGDRPVPRRLRGWGHEDRVPSAEPSACQLACPWKPPSPRRVEDSGAGTGTLALEMGGLCTFSPGSHPRCPGHEVTRCPPDPGCPARLQRPGMPVLGPQGLVGTAPAGQRDDCAEAPPQMPGLEGGPRAAEWPSAGRISHSALAGGRRLGGAGHAAR